MKRATGSTLVGLVLICAGALFLLQNFGLANFVTGAIWALLFAVAGAVFVGVFALDRDNWWAIIPGFTLLGLGALIGVSTIFPALAGPAAGLFFLAIGLSFWVIYATHPENWWAVIPGGTLVTLAVIVAISSGLGADEGRWVPTTLCLGLAATFGLVYFLPTPQGRMKWALWPASILAIMGLLMTAFVGELAGIIWPLILIAGGVAVLLRTMQKRTE
jgi:hypothetical protein